MDALSEVSRSIRRQLSSAAHLPAPTPCREAGLDGFSVSTRITTSRKRPITNLLLVLLLSVLYVILSKISFSASGACPESGCKGSNFCRISKLFMRKNCRKTKIFTFIYKTEAREGPYTLLYITRAHAKGGKTPLRAWRQDGKGMDGRGDGNGRTGRREWTDRATGMDGQGDGKRRSTRGKTGRATRKSRRSGQEKLKSRHDSIKSRHDSIKSRHDSMESRRDFSF